MKHEWDRGTTASTPDSPPEGYSNCGICGVEETDDNSDGDCTGGEIEQVSFHQAVFDDETMSPELKLYWLKACADQYLEELDEHERAVNILRSGFGVVEQQCAEGKHDLIPAICGVALRATVLKRGPDRKKA